MKKPYILAMPVTRHALSLGRHYPANFNGHDVGWAYQERKLSVEPAVGDLIPQEGVHQAVGMFLVQQRIYPHSGSLVARSARLVVVCIPQHGAEEPTPLLGKISEPLPSLVVSSEHFWSNLKNNYKWRQVTHEDKFLIQLGDLLTTAYRGTQCFGPKT